MGPARKLRDAERLYRGTITDPTRWDGFAPRAGDVILCTPAKSGTTWTQSMIAMLLNRTAELPDKLGRVSPWIDADIAPRAENEALLAAQSGRRVIKTHTPPEGWPVWEDVDVVAVFRHPMEVFLSIRKHLKNAKQVAEHPLLEPMDDALTYFLTRPFAEDEIDRDSLATIIRFFQQIVLSDRLPRKLVLNYAAISRDHKGTVRALDDFLGTHAAPELIDKIKSATEFGTMKERAADFAPEASNDFWHDTKSFFAGGRSGAWQQEFTEAQVAMYEAEFSRQLPDAKLRHWIETGHGDV